MNIDIKEIMRKERWNHKNAKAYERYMKVFHKAEKDFWIEAISKTKAKRVLDVGAGTGFLSEIALKLGCEVYALDISESMLKIAEEKFKKFKGFTSMVGDAENLPFKNEYFDLVMSRFVLWTLPNPSKMLSECLRVLKPNGYFLLADGESKDSNLFSRIITNIVDIIVGWRLPTWRKVYKKFDPHLPKWKQDKVVDELKKLGTEIENIIDLLKLEGLIYKILLPYGWHPYCIVGRKRR